MATSPPSHSASPQSPKSAPDGTNASAARSSRPTRDYIHLSVHEIADALATDVENGLSPAEADARLQSDGPNEIPQAKQSIWKVYVAPLLNTLIVIYLISATALVLLGQGTDTIITFAIVGVNCLVAVVQQIRAEKSLEALQRLSALTTTVVRNGVKKEIPTKELVAGDVIELRPGDKVPADARLIESVNMTVNEASLTGESEPVRKSQTGAPLPRPEGKPAKQTEPKKKRTVSQPGEGEKARGSEDALSGTRNDENDDEDDEIPLQEQFNMVFLGTYVATGNGRAIIVRTGAQTEIGKISEKMEQTSTGDIPLRRKINNLARFLGLGVILLLTAAFITKLVQLGIAGGLTANSVREGLAGSIGVAMNIMPINIPLLTTIILLTGVIAMAQHGVIISNLSAVESLGRVSVVCTDKTGTLTQNAMTVKKVWCDWHLYNVTGNGYDPEGEILEIPVLEESFSEPFEHSSVSKDLPGSPVNVQLHPNLQFLLRSGVLNNNATIAEEKVETARKGQPTTTVRKVIGAPTEAALLVLFEKAKISLETQKRDLEFVREFPFDSAVKKMSKVYRRPDGTYLALVKGASEVILPAASRVRKGTGVVELTPKVKEEIIGTVNRFAGKGFRVLSLTYRDLDALPSEGSEAEQRAAVESDLVYLGFVCILDPPRDGVRAAVEACESAGVTVVMITGDSRATAKAIAHDLAIHDDWELVVEGRQVSRLDPQEFERTAVFARVAPEHKQVIVQRYQDEFHRVVAMTGDGVNDALALNMADAGVAMGITGTDVAKQAADMIITDDAFTSIERGIREGRGLFQKIRVLIYFYICINITEGAIFFGAEFIPGFIMYEFWQLTLIYVSIHTWPAFVICFDTLDADIMKEKPRNGEEILNRRIFFTLLVNASLIALGAILSYGLTYSGVLPVHPDNVAADVAFVSTVHGDGVAAYHQKARTMCLITLAFSETFMMLAMRRPNKPLWRSLQEDRYRHLPGLTFTSFGIFIFVMYIFPLQEALYNMGFNFELMWLTAGDWAVAFLFSLPSIVGMEVYRWYQREKRGVHL